MSRPRLNPFDAVLGVVGFLFVVTAASYCVTVLRGVRPAALAAPQHPLDRFMADHGTTTLVVELVILAVATFLTIAVDERGGREARRLLQRERERAAAATPPADEAARSPATPSDAAVPDDGGPPLRPGERAP
jgi:hypothetical protein